LSIELSRFYHGSVRARVWIDRLESRCANSNFPQADFWPALASGIPSTMSDCGQLLPTRLFCRL